MTKIRFKCVCQKTLQVAATAAGRTIACPQCGAKVVVPPPQGDSPGSSTTSEPVPQESERRPARPSSRRRRKDPRTLPSRSRQPRSRAETDDAPDPWSEAPQSRKPRRRSRGKFPFTAILVGVGGLTGFVLVAMWVVDLLTAAGPGEVETGFQPAAVAEGGGQQIDDPELRIAEQFAEHARQRDVTKAIGLIDRDLFQTRLLGPEGSHQAISSDLKGGEVLGHFATYPLESTGAWGGRRLWRVLGKTTFRNQSAALLRYYSEPLDPMAMLREPEMLEALADLLTLEEFQQVATGIFRKQELQKTRRGGVYGNVPDSLDVLPPRTGFMLLVFETAGGEPRACDLVNVMGLLPLSRAGGQTYLEDWRVVQFGGGNPEARKVDRVQTSIYGEVAADMIPLPNWGITLEDDQSFSWSPQTAQKLFSEHRDVRAVRIFEAGLRTLVEKDQLAATLSAFRTDFPDDSGADLAAVVMAMMPHPPRIDSTTAPVIRAAAARLYSVWNDPFLLSVEAVAAGVEGDVEGSRQLISQARSAGFESIGQFQMLLRDALDRQDKPQVLTLLQQLRDDWSTVNGEDDEQALEQFTSRWERHLKDKERRAVAEEESDGSGRPGAPGFGGGRMGFRGPPGRMGSGRFPGPGSRRGGDSGAEGNGAPRGRPGEPPSQPPRRRPPTQMTGATVTIRITSSESVDGHAILQSLREKLEFRNHRMQFSGKQATITLGFEGTVDDIVKLIDFGVVESTDAETRTIVVRIN